MKLTPKQRSFLIEAKESILDSLDEGEPIPAQLELDPFEVHAGVLNGLCRKGIVLDFTRHDAGVAVTFDCAKVMKTLSNHPIPIRDRE